jgi:hypothetical protein
MVVGFATTYMQSVPITTKVVSSNLENSHKKDKPVPIYKGGRFSLPTSTISHKSKDRQHSVQMKKG